MAGRLFGAVGAAGRDVVLDQADHVGEREDSGLGEPVGVQSEKAVGILDPNVRGPAVSPNR